MVWLLIGVGFNMQFVRFSVLLTLVLGLSIGAASAQIPGVPGPAGIAGEYRSDVTGNVIGWSPDWMLGTKDVDEILRYDQTMLFNPLDLTIVDIFFTAQDVDAATMRDDMMERSFGAGSGIQIVEAGNYGDIAYALIILTTDDGVFGSFVLVNTSGVTGTGVNLVAPVDSFGQAVQRAQGSLTIDGSPILSGTDGPRLQMQLDAAPPMEMEATSPIGTPEDQASGDTTFTSDVWGYEVTYSPDWEVVESEGDGDLEISTNDQTVTLGFMAVENPDIDQAGMQAALIESFTESIQPHGGLLVSITSDDERAVMVVEMDGLVLIQELIIISPDVLVIVTGFIDGDLETVLGSLNEVTLNESGIFLLLTEGDNS